MKSITRKLTLLIISTLTLTIFAAAIQGYKSSISVANKIYDDELRMLMQGVAALYDEIARDEKLNKLTNQATLSAKEMGEQFAFQVIVNNKVLARSANASDVINSPVQAGFGSQNFSGARWRVFMQASRTDPEIWYVVAQQLSLRNRVTDEMIISSMLPIIFAIPLLAVLIYLIVNRSLLPLKTLSQRLSERELNNLSAIDLSHDSIELSPVVNTINQLFARLQSSFEREREFVSHAAHELRTPLSILKINLHNLLSNAPSNRLEIQKLQSDTDRMIQVINQLLLLSKTNPNIVAGQFTGINLYQTAEQVISDLYPDIEKREQSIALIGEAAWVNSQAFLLQTLITNLVANASKYSPQGGEIEVAVHSTEQGCVLKVSDNGPGIEEGERKKVLLRFYRTSAGQHSEAIGSGLGLAIVAQILQLHSARLSLGESALGGLLVEVYFPASSDKAGALV